MRARSLLLAALAAVLVAVPVRDARAAGSAPAAAKDSLAAQILREVNRVRLERGLPALRLSPALGEAATAHSRAMLVHGFFGHDSRDGTSFGDRIRRYYVTGAVVAWSAGENLVYGTPRLDAAAAVRAWLASPSHRRTMLNPAFREAGVGVATARRAPAMFGSGKAVVVTLDLGSRRLG